MAVNAWGYFDALDDLPDDVKALGDARATLWMGVYNSVVEHHQDAPQAKAWAAVTPSASTEPGPIFTWVPRNKRRQLDDDTHDSSQAGRDTEPADVANPNAVSPMMAEAASQGFNTTDPEEDTPEAHDQNIFGFGADTEDTQQRETFKKPNAAPTTRSNPPAAL